MPRELQEVQASRIFRESADKSDQVVSSMYRPPLSLGKIPGTNFC